MKIFSCFMGVGRKHAYNELTKRGYNVLNTDNVEDIIKDAGEDSIDIILTNGHLGTRKQLVKEGIGFTYVLPNNKMVPSYLQMLRKSDYSSKVVTNAIKTLNIYTNPKISKQRVVRINHKGVYLLNFIESSLLRGK